MPRKTAGRDYPHISSTAKPHNHRMCPVVHKIAEAGYAGTEQWGTEHRWHVRDEKTARDAKQAFYAAKRCAQLRTAFGEDMSTQSDVEPGKNGTWAVWVKVWPRSIARAEIARRVKAGEPLAYNVLRGT